MNQVIGSQNQSPSPHLGILLLNTGTPDAPTPSAVRRFLADFLSDPYVIDYPRGLWLPLLYGVILNVRPRRSARLYQRIWGLDGSPILTITGSLRDKLQTAFAEQSPGGVQVEFAMRYGEPSIPSILAMLRHSGVKKLIILPLFPQYSGTTTGTSLGKVFETLQSWNWMPGLQVISDYHDHPAYIDAIAESIRSTHVGIGKLLFSFHGIPQRYVDVGDPYESQCQHTASLVAEQLDLGSQGWEVVFQSRFGPEEWTRPYTDDVLTSLGEAGTPNVSVVCPGFPADCLETLEEIEYEFQHIFSEAGGGEFTYIPALNDSLVHVNMLAKIILQSGKLL